MIYDKTHILHASYIANAILHFIKDVRNKMVYTK